MVELKDITLCCVDNRHPELGLNALERTCKEIKFQEVLFFTDSSFNVSSSIENLKIIPLDHVTSIDAYSHFMLKELNQFIHTSHVLSIQWDGYVINPQSWQQEFLNYDYIGAPWPFESGNRVGNGGFSLRSKRLLMALQDDRIKAFHPEDNCICMDHREFLEKEYGIRFPSPELAEKFAYEFAPPRGNPFGFHGFFHFPALLNDQELLSFIEQLPESTLLGPYIKLFVQRIAINGSKQVNRALQQKMLTILKHSDTIVQSSQSYSLLRGLLKAGQVKLGYVLFNRRMQLVGLDKKYFKLIFRFIPGMLNNLGYRLRRALGSQITS